MADLAVLSMSQADVSENPLDSKCGLMHGISQVRTADALFDVKLALTSFDVRKRSTTLYSTDDVLKDDFVERVQFRLWTTAKPQGDAALFS
jgi:hypothetical protein